MRSSAARWLAILACAWAAAAHAQETEESRELLWFPVLYEATIVPSERAARVAIHVEPEAAEVEWIRFAIDPERHRDFAGDGRIVQNANGKVEWDPPEGGGTLRYVFSIDHLRDERSYDARCSSRWAIFRGDDLIPRARLRSNPRARSRARLRLRLPEGWSAVGPYRRDSNGTFEVSHPNRRLDRPTGWFVAGHLGVVREQVVGTRIAIAGPVGQSFRRLDILAMLRWNLPVLRDILGRLPSRLAIVGAGDPMWRGGLSGPNSLFVHASRPLITSDGTSPLLHELMHSVIRIVPGEDGDWIAEGLAEYYALELLRRSGTLSSKRYERSLARLRERGERGGSLRIPSVKGDTQARAVTVLHELDREIREATGDAKSLDDLLRAIAAEGGTMTTERFRALAEEISGASLEPFFARRVPAAQP
jgi:hypothetical protein